LLRGAGAAIAALGLTLFEFECGLTFEAGAATPFLVRANAAWLAFRAMAANPVLIWARILA